ncbi:hypothetical protein KQI30_15175 [Clostridium bornimense]|uniref:hypothetical protein n=1 Tax=Clostridium bornimense TaxID=1216932 RepID=UPI001C0F83F4|nr:hypothetical protein [Clostridium bornimense]MBU5317592.1 hypothetical protein [Clostridium bornimense]
MKFSKSRFHIEYGPISLFERVSFIMKDVTELKMNSNHFKARLQERNINAKVINELKQFNINEWKVVTAEVRNDKGKFINSTWEKVIDGVRYWVTIGFNDTIETIVIKNSSGKDKCITSGELYDYVSKVNKELMKT